MLGRPGVAIAIALACAAVVASACQRTTPEEDLNGRVRQYLELKQKQDWQGIYDGLLDPEVKETVKAEDFLKVRTGGLEILGFSVVETKVEDGQGKVRANLDTMVTVLSPRGGTTMIRKDLVDSQDWVLRDGRWYVRLQG